MNIVKLKNNHDRLPNDFWIDFQIRNYILNHDSINIRYTILCSLYKLGLDDKKLENLDPKDNQLDRILRNLILTYGPESIKNSLVRLGLIPKNAA